jgi:hypothetical protein
VQHPKSWEVGNNGFKEPDRVGWDTVDMQGVKGVCTDVSPEELVEKDVVGLVGEDDGSPTWVCLDGEEVEGVGIFLWEEQIESLQLDPLILLLLLPLLGLGLLLLHINLQKGPN